MIHKQPWLEKRTVQQNLIDTENRWKWSSLKWLCTFCDSHYHAKRRRKNSSAIWKQIYSDLKCLECCSFTLSQSRERNNEKKNELYLIIVRSVVFKHFFPLRAQENKNSHTLYTPPHKRLHDKSSVVVEIWFKWPENVHNLRWYKVGWWFAGLGPKCSISFYIANLFEGKYINLKTSNTNLYMDASGKHFNNINTSILFNITSFRFSHSCLKEKCYRYLLKIIGNLNFISDWTIGHIGLKSELTLLKTIW